ncbi:hypothetical protein A2334_03405 [Candidatus Roizmanbacteria bacterium RIFOXYB2_FULL_38_10]|uniref:HD domain-containing protein n=1 Tax=Candidatus Roizmanbacteria bacterium RIFOXYD1_FULL_38_12 TaxID=1802093 RepID=A0A1F7L142_9BACT|nr:MAG: hypothetical protein A3K47_03440 [Candidatus Roizmanbacteria bacterium RIFOXYA2_FULL_38_14]OGK63816.1 MAG: hypothetical protein A3K27_03440 [Candidatus Roizmanbacteria bacterium RIFOXYA1_FULL_37_12]OGK65662.1 MAG: hypothetical protein A3K38_03440 [Candidatus Roizmanbacteria bacterium RIFOXYB1_FULL_40_23]OGK67450.1 MAG: hypothetical protein A2334_03405 [Candidatus Roizmanbacteria bacterium RIFOXYB2_FULL_38_10]OGK70067.1 MAG: hypothetical protein A3K21_03445 [Candidatus Roizmanbacteria ba
MKLLYTKIWNLAKPFYKKGRPMDIDHIQWMMKMVKIVCKKEGLDEEILMPLAILHDVGYAILLDPVNTNYYKKDVRKAHMKTGEEIAKKILASVNYPKDKSKRIIKYVGIHDNWAFGEVEIYINDRILGTFKDLDYLWIYTKKGFDAIKKVLHKNEAEMFKQLKDEVSPIYGKKPFSTSLTRTLREIYLQERKIEYNLLE